MMPPATTFTEEVGDNICNWIATGGTLVDYCRDHQLSYGTVMQWLERQPRFAEGYARARIRQVDRFADDILSIADTEKDPNRAKLMVDTRKWLMSKLNAKKYGDKLQHTGADGDGPIKIKVEDAWARPVIEGAAVVAITDQDSLASLPTTSQPIDVVD